MAVHQAAEAFRLFTGLKADTARMRGVFESFDRPPERDR
jgi:shikimate 5-dehydrogenase